MKRAFFLAALATLSAGAAVAQSSVTIYGRLNESVERQRAKKQTTIKLVDSASRIGFKGTEDLGGGLKANFIIEHGFAADTGTASATFWGRQSEVNLSSSAVGTVRMGTFTSDAYYATADYVSMHNHDTGTSEDKLYNYIGRNRNKIGYSSPDLGGVTFLTSMSLKEATEAGRRNNYDVAINYNGGPLQLGFGYEKADFKTVATGAVGKNDQYAFRALYDLGGIVLGGYVQRAKIAGLGTRNNFRLSAMYVMDASEFHVNYGRAGDYSKTPGVDTKATQYTFGYNYNLSKRTKVYAFYTKLQDKSGLGSNEGGTGGLVSGGGTFGSFAAGVRHNF